MSKYNPKFFFFNLNPLIFLNFHLLLTHKKEKYTHAVPLVMVSKKTEGYVRINQREKTFPNPTQFKFCTTPPYSYLYAQNNKHEEK